MKGQEKQIYFIFNFCYFLKIQLSYLLFDKADGDMYLLTK